MQVDAMGLREQKKEETRRALLKQAGTLFAAKGYQHVTTAEIARAAGIAEGTLFNYFRNKGELFIAALMPQAVYDTEQSVVLEEISPHSLAAAIVGMLDQQLSGIESVEKRILQDYFTIVYGGGLSGAAEARAGLFAADERMQTRIEHFFAAQKRAHATQMAAFDVQLAAACIFGCVVTLISQYTLIDDWTYKQFKSSMYEQILFILTGQVPSRG